MQNNQDRDTRPATGQDSTTPNMNYNTSAVQVGNQIRDGDEFILLARSHQSEGFKIWSSGDKLVTTQLYEQAGRQFDELKQTA